MALTARLQVLFEPKQLARLQAIADADGRSVGSLVRQAVERTYLSDDRTARMAAVERLAAMSLPAADWGHIERGSIDCDDDE
jgi:hypothetical protein